MVTRAFGLGVGAAAVLAALLATTGASAQGPIALDARVAAIQPDVSTASYPTIAGPPAAKTPLPTSGSYRT